MLQRPNRAPLEGPQVEHSGNVRKVWSLYHGRWRKPIVRVVPDADSPLYRVAWPDIGPSAIANLSWCKDAALQWAEWNAVTKYRNLSVAQRLKLLNNFSWSSSPMRVDRVERESLRTVLDGWSGAS